MDAKTQAGQVPKCVLFLALSALASHTLLLVGNLYFADSISKVAHSTVGWSDAGIGLADSFSGELSNVMSKVNDDITTAVEEIQQVQDMMDLVLSTVGNATDNRTQAGASRALAQIGAFTKPELSKMTDELKKKLQQFLAVAKPILEQMSELLYQKFSDKITKGIETFSVTLDKSQKVFDQIMGQINGCCKNEEYMLHNTFTLFDVSNSGGITEKDLQDTAALYSISALKGGITRKLHSRYDVNSDGVLDRREFAAFVHANELPMVMPLVLRAYAKSLAEAAGQIRQAKTRSEIAVATVSYLTLVVSKNKTKVGWISNSLVDGSLPLEFTSAVLVQLALDTDDPAAFTTSDVGATIVQEMVALNSQSVLTAYSKIQDPNFWVSEGLQLDKQPEVVSQITNWTDQAAKAKTGEAAKKEQRALLLQAISQRAGGDRIREDIEEGHLMTTEELAMRAKELAKDGLRDFAADRLADKEAKRKSLYFSQASQLLLAHLFGGSSPGTSRNPDSKAAVNAGQPAAAATLHWAQALALNASHVADEFQHASFVYSGQSSGAVDSYANQVQEMLKQVQAFLKVMEQYATPAGIKNLDTMIMAFTINAESELMEVLDKGGMLSTMQTHSFAVHDLLHRAEFPTKEEQVLGSETPPAVSSVSSVSAQGSSGMINTDAWSEVNSFLQQLLNVLPSAKENLSFARTTVTKMGAKLDSVFLNFKKRGPTIFDDTSAYYKKVWILHFCFFAPCTLLALLYGFWANGYWGGPKAVEGRAAAEEEAAPKTFCEKCATCFSACAGCFRGCHDNLLFFWSILIICQVLVLCMFLSAIALLVLAGIQSFLAAGCTDIYILGDYTVCTHALTLVHNFLQSFKVGSNSYQDACMSSELLLCQHIGKTMAKGTLLMVIGGFAASIFSFQLLIESAVLRERARCRRIVEEQFGKST